MDQPNKSKLDPFRILEFPAAIFVINITLFTIIWKSVGVSWMPFGLGEAFGNIFAEGHYARDMERNEAGYNLFFFFLYGVMGSFAQIASLRIWMLRRKSGDAANPGHWRWIFGLFHLVIAMYHVLFVFQFVKGKMILEGMAPWQMLATQTLYVLELFMAVELLLAPASKFFRRKVCLDVLSCCNLLPFLVFWVFALTSFNNPSVSKLVEYSLFTIIPLLILLIEWGTDGFSFSYGLREEQNNQLLQKHE